MRELSGKERRELRGMAHGLRPVCFVGKNSVSDALLESVRAALEDHELIKLKFVDGKEARKALTEQIAAETDSAVVGLIGNVAILYREQPDEEKRRIWLE